MYAYLDNREFKTLVLILALVVAVLILLFPDETTDLFGNDLSMWRGFTGFAVIGLVWIFLRPLWGSTLEDAVNEATLAASIGVFVVAVVYWHGVGSVIPTLAAIGFAFQTGKHRFID